VATPFLLIVMAATGLLAYFGMFSCHGAFYESGCEYRSPTAGVVFVVVTTLVWTPCLLGIVSVNRRTPPTGWRWRIGCALAALTISVWILFTGSPWE